MIHMEYEHMFAQPNDGRRRNDSSENTAPGSAAATDPRIRTALTQLRHARIGPMSQDEAEETLALLTSIQSVAASLVCDVAAMLTATNADADPVETLRQAGKLPGRESKRTTEMARQLTEMPKVKERFATGGITVHHVNALANAAEKVGPETVEADQGLLEAADRMPADRFGRHARKWSEKKMIQKGLDPLERQRRAREAKLWVEKETGLGVLMAKLPRHQYEQLRQAVDDRYLRLLRGDSRDGASPDEVRIPKQRLADAIYELLTGRDAVSGETIPGEIGIRTKAGTRLIVTASIGVIDGTDPEDQVEITGVGPAPRSILKTLSPDTELAGIIFDRAGRTLWLGRNQRLGNAAQRLAVAVRDGGCFECGAPMHRCELHHIAEWNRDRGRTDIDNLVAVCRRHHKWLETKNLFVRRTSNGYETRPRTGLAARTKQPARLDPG